MSKKCILGIFAMLLIALLLLPGCEAYGYPTTTTPAPPRTETPSATVVNTKDSALLAVYQHLLEQAESHTAKRYLADFYTACDNWTTESEYFKDGSGIWYVQVDMGNVKPWTERAHWQKAGWFVYRNGKVVAANRLETNALRIEADLQELSLKP
ncbi:MAG: hypothetical protein PHR43_06485 [Dehalococcoidales bacterium]|nr:hypothetical protein [Dehalococcoidales bacterium]